MLPILIPRRSRVMIALALAAFPLNPQIGRADDVSAQTKNVPATEKQDDAPPLIALKLDDMRADQEGEIPARWKRFAAFVVERRVKAGIGIIADSLENPSPAYIDHLKRLRATGFIEYWNHGYDHKRWTEEAADGSEKTVAEFRGSGAEHQKERIALAQKLAYQRLGEPFRSFGAPFNAIDAATATALELHPEITVWLYGPSPSSPIAERASQFVATRVGSVNLERATFKTDFAWFIAGYEKNAASRDYFVLQGHPNGWDDAAFAEFVKIINYLEQRGTEFVFPSELPDALARRASKSR